MKKPHFLLSKSLIILLLLIASACQVIAQKSSRHAAGVAASWMCNTRYATWGTHLKYQWSVTDMFRLEPSVGFNFTHDHDIPDGEQAGIAAHFLLAYPQETLRPYLILGGDYARYSYLHVHNSPGASAGTFNYAPVYMESIQYVNAYTAKFGAGLEWCFMKHLSLQLEVKGHVGSTTHSSKLDQKYQYTKYNIKEIVYFDTSLSLMYRI